MIIKEVPTEDKHEVFSLINQLKSLLNTKPSSGYLSANLF